MAEQQNIQIQSVQIPKSNQSSKVSMRFQLEESFEDQQELQDQKIASKNNEEVIPQKDKERLFKIKVTKKCKQNTIKQPRVKFQNKTNLTKIHSDQRFINKNRKSSSDKKLNKSKSLKLEELSKDIIKHPLKYKIVQQLYLCKPQVIYNLNKTQVDLIQHENMKIKGDRYLRQVLCKAKNRKQQLITQSNSLPKKIKTSKLNLFKLIQIQEAKGNKVLKKIKNHLRKGETSIFAHLESSASIDSAFVSFLKTKIKRAEMSCEN